MKLLYTRVIPLIFLTALCTSAFAEDDIVIYEGDPSSDFVIGGEDTDDITLYFGSSLSHFLRWDADREIFIFSDDVDFGGNQLIDMRIENLDASPQCDIENAGRLYHNTTNTYSFVCDGSIWKQIDEESGTGVVPYMSSLSPDSIDAGETTTLSITGGGFSPRTNVIIPGFQGTVSAVTIVSPTEIQVDVTSTTEDTGLFDVLIETDGVTNQAWDNNGVDALEAISTIVLIPDVDDTIWERESGVVTSEGKIMPSSTALNWSKGGSFGTVPADTDFVLSFDLAYMSGQSFNGAIMIGMDNSDPNVNYTSIDYAMYFADTALFIYENGVARANIGTISLSDRFHIIREGTTIKYAVGDIIVYTSTVSSSTSMVFDSALYALMGAENIELTY